MRTGLHAVSRDRSGAGAKLHREVHAPDRHSRRGRTPLKGDESKLEKGLQKIKEGGIAFDTDKDGTSDYDELKEGNDPDKPGDSRLCGPAYGCGAHIAKAPAKNGGAWVLAACAAALVTFGFRRRRSS